uniref:C-type lectin domain-containing protein n=1 Tax=Cyprinus carpio carpio TaxID=630221 RepID=A0A9J7YI53_CYPCA
MKAYIILLIVICGLTKALIREHVYLRIPKNWTDAQSYCRTYYEDLSTITSQEEQDMLIQLSGGNQIFQWIGLYSHIQHTRNWLWSDGNSVSFTDWDKGQPNNVNGSQYCVATINKWNDYYCNYLLPFFYFSLCDFTDLLYAR